MFYRRLPLSVLSGLSFRTVKLGKSTFKSASGWLSKTDGGGSSAAETCPRHYELFAIRQSSARRSERCSELGVPDSSLNKMSSYEEFTCFFPELMKSIRSLYVLHELPEMQEWIEKVVVANVLGGKMNRAIALIDAYKAFQGNQVTAKGLETAIVLGWSIELLQAFFLVADDIMDESLTRRMKPCWYRTNDLGVKAFNDSILLEACIYEVIKTYCRDQPFYADILDLFHDVTMRTSIGQSLDLQSSPNTGQKPDLGLYTTERYSAIVKYKTAYYSFYLPVALAMHLVGLSDGEVLKKAETILLPMGHFFQVQDDFLDCYGDPKVIGKHGTDIEDGKCTWLIVTALSKCNQLQLQEIQEHYGLKNPESVRIIKGIYNQLEMPRLYAEYEDESYERITSLVKEVENHLPVCVFLDFIAKIYKRKH